jgi:hypothetical protein
MTHRRFAPFSAADSCPARLAKHARDVGLHLPGIALLSFIVAPAAIADNVSRMITRDAVIIYQSPMDERHVELRRALVSEAAIPAAKPERQRLSPEQREALNREVRQAVRSAYESRTTAAR